MCPRCGKTLARIETGSLGLKLMGWFFLRPYRCTAGCSYSTIGVSRSLIRKKRKRIRVAFVVMFFFLAAGFTVKYMLARSGAERTTPVDEGIGESD